MSEGACQQKFGSTEKKERGGGSVACGGHRASTDGRDTLEGSSGWVHSGCSGRWLEKVHAVT